MSEIILPEELYEKLDLLELSGEVEVEVVDNAKNAFTLKAANVKMEREAAPRWFLLPTAIASLIFLIFALVFNQSTIPLAGTERSIETGVTVIANVIAFITFTLTYFLRRENLYRKMSKKVYWRTFLTVVASGFIISSLSVMMIFWFLNQIFYGVRFDIFTSTLIFTLFAGILSYLVIFAVDNFSIEMLVNMLIFVASAGAVIAMVRNGNPYWWQRNFSLLGTQESQASLEFNLTLVVSGALFIALIDYIFVSLSAKLGRNWRHLTLKILLTLSALSIAGIGLVPNNDVGHALHDRIAMFIIYFMGIAILGIRWLLPEAGTDFVNISYLAAVLLLTSYVLWKYVGYLNLTAFEISSFAIGFSWLMLFINRLTKLIWDERKVYKVKVFIEE